jgi:DNA-binding MarR family transcriptional regulator
MEQFRRLSHAIGRHHLHQFHAFGPFANPHHGQGRVLSILKMKEEITQKELGYLLDMRNQSLGELLTKLEKRGYITRTPSEEDKRTTIVRLTETGKAAAETAGNREENDFDLFDCLNDEEKAASYNYLERIIAAFEEHAAENGMDRGAHGFGDLEESEGLRGHMRERVFDRFAHGGRGFGGQRQFFR